MLVISLTSIPPRFGQLAEVLAGLQKQGADRVALAIPRRYARFGAGTLPELPAGVTRLETGTDLGPAGKLLAAARAFPGADILCCDDDWRYGPGWADALRTAQAPGTVPAGSTWPTERIGRRGGTVAQGFAGLLVPGDIAARIPPPPAEAWAVDDVWISGWIEGLGARIVEAPAARAACTPLQSPGALQDRGDRDTANRAAAAWINEKFGIWPLL